MSKLTGIICFLPLGIAANSFAQDFTDLSFDELMEIEVTSVSKRAEKLSQAAAAVHVVTQTEIRRSGATSIPEALRLVPGVYAAQIDSNKWSIGVRGFGGRLANKLLVMIDGRSIYTPTYSGVYWENHDYVMADIERIEVIRGPGATLWGTNAVNGVINIITKGSCDTHGGQARVAYGNELQGLVSVRQGGNLNGTTHLKVYAKGKQLDSASSASGDSQQNDGEYLRSGFRLDHHGFRDASLTVNGDLYKTDIDQELNIPLYESPFGFELNQSKMKTEGGNLQARWVQHTGLDSEFSVNVWYDFYNREEIRYDEQLDTLDLSFQHQLVPADNHEVVWGGGYRWGRNVLENGAWISVDDSKSIYGIWNLFAQDTIRFPDQDLSFTLGTKIEGNSYSDVEVQPNIRVSWVPDDDMTVWGAIARASRIPSRGETDTVLSMAAYPPGSASPLPVFMQVSGSDDYESEHLIAYEAGIRWQPVEKVAMDLALFYNDYSNLRSYTYDGYELTSINGQPFLRAPLYFVNNIEGYSYGGELSTTWYATENAKYQFSYSFIDIHLEDTDPNEFSDIVISMDEDRVPQHQLSLWASYNLTPDWELDVRLFYNDEQPWKFNGYDYTVDAYTDMDLRIGWQINEWLNTALTGRNLLQDHHLEYMEGTWRRASELERSVYADISVSW
ncbi:TonB-dependent receptor plug domain-containing protein [Vibrio sp. JC009]|uniref:TonB-dependent receptor plug domain-containing protein n=1 Tax=Vibrio sp. JC009 TaxID=2912314 RepID=UPI0023AEF73A|nr:TonB-dependent receptor [Vibrio sp. JC009]WED24707.1 TonB-dependent receptor plug domain-containing protein [Vibrio sp. JC009]